MRITRRKHEIKSDSFPEMDGGIIDMFKDLGKLCRFDFRFIKSKIKKAS